MTQGPRPDLHDQRQVTGQIDQQMRSVAMTEPQVKRATRSVIIDAGEGS